MKRVLYFYAFQQFDTGSPRALAAMVDALDRSRYQPLFWATGEGPLVVELERKGVEIVRRPAGEVTWRRPFGALRRILDCARELRARRVDIVHANEFGWNLDLVLGAALARIPVVLHVHNPLDVEFRNLDRVAASRVLFVSRAHRDHTGHLGRIAAKSGVLYNPIDIEAYAGGRNVRGALGFDAEDVIVLSVCQLTPTKGLDVVLAIARELIPKSPRLHFVVAGRALPPHEAFGKAVRAEAETGPLAGRVHFLGTRGDVPDLLASADIFLLPTRSETFGLVVAEAMAASLPVVTTGVGGLPEIVRSDDAGYTLDPDDLPAFLSAVTGLVADPARRRAMGAAARASLDGRFDRETFARSLDQVYRTL